VKSAKTNDVSLLIMWLKLTPTYLMKFIAAAVVFLRPK
jgi:hypothetical protein